MILIDEELNAVSLRLFNEERYQARWRSRSRAGQAPRCAVRPRRGIVEAKPEPWRGLGTTVASEIRRRAKFLESRIRRLQAKPWAGSKM